MSSPLQYHTATLVKLTTPSSTLDTVFIAGDAASAELFALLPSGPRCTSNTECSSGLCVDGFCCEATCGASCSACDLAGLEGTCSPVPSGSPHGARACKGYACGAGACLDRCTNDQECVLSTYCVDAKCLPRKQLKTPCALDQECASGFCITRSAAIGSDAERRAPPATSPATSGAALRSRVRRREAARSASGQAPSAAPRATAAIGSCVTSLLRPRRAARRDASTASRPTWVRATAQGNASTSDGRARRTCAGRGPARRRAPRRGDVKTDSRAKAARASAHRPRQDVRDRRRLRDRLMHRGRVLFGRRVPGFSHVRRRRASRILPARRRRDLLRRRRLRLGLVRRRRLLRREMRRRLRGVRRPRIIGHCVAIQGHASRRAPPMRHRRSEHLRGSCVRWRRSPTLQRVRDGDPLRGRALRRRAVHRRGHLRRRRRVQPPPSIDCAPFGCGAGGCLKTCGAGRRVRRDRALQRRGLRGAARDPARAGRRRLRVHDNPGSTSRSAAALLALVAIATCGRRRRRGDRAR